MKNFNIKQYDNSDKFYVEWFEPQIRNGKPLYNEKGKPVTKRRRISCDTNNLAIARQRAPQIVANGGTLDFNEKVTRRFGKSDIASEVTVAQLFDNCSETIWRDHKSQATLKSTVRILNQYLVDDKGDSLLLSKITYDLLENLVSQFRGNGYAPATIRRKLEVLSGALAQACKKKDAEGNPWLTGRPIFPKFVVNNKRERVLTEREEDAIIKCLDARIINEPHRQWYRFKALYIFLRDMGARKGETLLARPSRIGERGGNYFITFPKEETKTGKTRSVPLSEDFLQYLPTLIEMAGHKDNLLFPFQPGGVNYMWSNIRDDMAAMGFDISDVRIHDLRHGCATKLVRASVPILNVSKMLGHSSIAVTAGTYSHLYEDDLLHSMDIINKKNRRSVRT